MQFVLHSIIAGALHYGRTCTARLLTRISSKFVAEVYTAQIRLKPYCTIICAPRPTLISVRHCAVAAIGTPTMLGRLQALGFVQAHHGLASTARKCNRVPLAQQHYKKM